MNWFSKEKDTPEIQLQREETEENTVVPIKEEPVLTYMPTSQIRDVCWKDIENAEHWARRLIHEVLSEQYGSDYFNYADESGNRLFKNEIIKTLQKRVDSDRNRFPRLVDALFLENIIDILCNDSLFAKHFKPALKGAYPCGKEDAKHHLSIIKDVRNKYTHSNTISIRDAERAICYCHDFVDSLRTYYQTIGKEKDYNVPTFLKLTDSQGMTHYFSSQTVLDGYEIRLRSGDIYRVEVEVDPTFKPSDYKIQWTYEWDFRELKKAHNQTSIDIVITNAMVGRHLKIHCHIISNKDWHKHGWYDDSFSYIISTILPPIEDSY